MSERTTMNAFIQHSLRRSLVVLALLCSVTARATPNVNFRFEAPKTRLAVGETMAVRVFLDDGTELTTHEITYYATSDEEVATVDATGLVTAIAPGQVTISASNVEATPETGAEGSLVIEVFNPSDLDDDSMPNDWETEHGLDPDSAADGIADADQDGLSNADEFKHGTNPEDADTDDDTRLDGYEVEMGLDPKVAERLNDTGFKMDQNCVVSILNRVARVRPNGSWILTNIPATGQQVRARATCQFWAFVSSSSRGISSQSGGNITMVGHSDFIVVPPNGQVQNVKIRFDAFAPVPAKLLVTAPAQSLTAGETTQLTSTIVYPDSSTADATPRSKGTNYRSSNPGIASVSEDGLVTGIGSGSAIINVTQEGALALFRVTVSGSSDSDGDTMPDDWELANGFNPNDPSDAAGDADSDGLTNVQEYTQGSNPRAVDSDGDGVTDGVEVQTGTSPTDAGSFNLSTAVTSMTMTPARLVLTHTPITTEVTRQLQVTGTLLDGRTIDLTRRATNYSSGNLDVVSLANNDGLVVAGIDGTTTVTATNGSFSASTQITVTTLDRIAVSSTWFPAAVTGTDVAGDLAYVLAGGKLTILDITQRDHPLERGSVTVGPNTKDVRVSGNFAYVAASAAGIVVVDVSNSAAPAVVTTFDTPGTAVDLAISGSHLYVADESGGLRILDITTPSAPQAEGDLAFSSPIRAVALSGTIAIALAEDMLYTVDVQNNAVPLLRGSANTTRALDVAAAGTFAYVARYTSGFTLFDFTNPAAPFASGNVGGSFFYPTDVAVNDGFAFFADERFVNAIPVVDVRFPANPQYRATLNLSSFGDPDGTSIQADDHFAYLGAGSQFLIARHSPVVDELGVPPTVSFVAPDATETLVSGGQQRITLAVADDVGIDSVIVTVNGMRTPALEQYPYSAEISVPNIAAKIVVTATDFGGGTATATRTYQVSSGDPGTTVTGRVLTSQQQPAVGAKVHMADAVIVNDVLTDANGIYRIESVATSNGDVSVAVELTSGTQRLGKISSAVTPVRGGETVMPDVVLGQGLTVTISSTRAGQTVLAGESVPIRVEYTNDSNNEHVHLELFVNGSYRGRLNHDDDTNPFLGSFIVPETSEPLSVYVRATDSITFGYLESAPIEFQAAPDPGTTVTGRVLDADGVPVNGATVEIHDSNRSTTTDATGAFQINDVPSINAFGLIATKTIGNITRGGTSASITPVRGGTTVVPDIHLGRGPTLTITSPESAEPFLVHNQPLTFTIGGTTDPGSVYLDVEVIATGMDFPRWVGELPRTIEFTVPEGITSYTLTATAHDSYGNDVTATMTWSVTADPLSTISGTIRTNGGTPVAGATVLLRGAANENVISAQGTYVGPLAAFEATTDANGSYTLPGVPTNQGEIVVRATKLAGTDGAIGESAAMRLVRDGTTNVADISIAVPDAVTSKIAVDTFTNTSDAYARKLAVGNGGSVHFLDFTNPARPRLHGTLVIGDWNWLNVIRFYDNGNRAVLISDEPKVYLADVTNLDAPVILGELEIDGWPTAAAVSGSTLAIASDDLLLIDITDPTQMEEVGRLPLPRGASRLAISGSLLICAEQEWFGQNPASGISVIDITNRATPALLGRVPLNQMLGGIAIQGSRAYLTGGTGIHVLDFSDPAQPTITHDVVTTSPFEPSALAQSGDRLFVTGYRMGSPSVMPTVDLDGANATRGDDIATPEMAEVNGAEIVATDSYLSVVAWPDPTAPPGFPASVYIVRIPEPNP